MVWIVPIGGGGLRLTEPAFSTVKLLLPFDGSDASTTITDGSTTGHTVTARGNAQLDTAQKVFGTASLLLDGTGDCVTVPDHADFVIGSNDAEISMRIRYAAAPGAQVAIVGQWDGSTNLSWVLGHGGSGYTLDLSTNGSASTSFAGLPHVPTVDTWYDLTLIVIDGRKFLLLLDGEINLVGTISADLYNSTNTLAIGGRDTGGSYDQGINGWIDNFRFCVGGSRFSGALFQLPTSAFPTS